MEALKNCPACGSPLAPHAQFCSGCGARPPASEPSLTPDSAPAAQPAMKSGPAPVIGVIAAVLFGVILVIGIVAAVTVPNLVSSIQRAKQKRTVADMLTLAVALNGYQRTYRHYPPGNDIGQLCSALVPKFLADCPRVDAWSSARKPREIAYAAWGAPPECSASPDDPQCGAQEYGLASAGRDGLFEVALFTGYDRAQTDNFDRDIVIRNGDLVRAPRARTGTSRRRGR